MKQKATIALFIVTIIWGCTFLWLKRALDSADSVSASQTNVVSTLFVTLRFGLTLPIFLYFTPSIRKNLGDEFPIIFDSGIRSGSDILRALALGADFVMLGRPLMYAVGADGARGLRRLINIIKEELSTNLGLVGLTDINNVDEKIIADKYLKDIRY